MARAIDMGIVAFVGLILDMGDGDGDAPFPLLRGVVDAVEGAEGRFPLEGQRLGDRRGERRLAMIDMPDGAHVDVRLRPTKPLLGHAFKPPSCTRFAGAYDVLR